MPDSRTRILVTGRVQGVFFRQSLKAEARRRGVTGWVRNLDDGRVEAVLEGDAGAVAGVVEWARRGPANSRVEGVETHEGAFAGGFAGFEVRY